MAFNLLPILSFLLGIWLHGRHQKIASPPLKLLDDLEQPIRLGCSDYNGPNRVLPVPHAQGPTMGDGFLDLLQFDSMLFPNLLFNKARNNQLLQPHTGSILNAKLSENNFAVRLRCCASI